MASIFSGVVGGLVLQNPRKNLDWKEYNKFLRSFSPENVAFKRETLPEMRKLSLRCSVSASGSRADTWNQDEESDTFSKYSGYIAGAAEESDKLEQYDVEKIAKIFKKRPILLIRRVLQIASTLGRWAAVRYLDAQLGRSEFMFKKRAAQLRAALVQLGPAFVKIAQAVSSRPDVISPEYLDELALLQDRIAPFSTKDALDIIEKELGVPVEMLFSEISPQPIAAASLGQVYQARLRPNGQAVAVKVQRPGVQAAIGLDIYILRILAGYAQKLARLNTDLQAVVDEWASSLFREMNYIEEAQNGVRFRKLFGSLPDVVVPRMYSDLSSRKVLIMEWLQGQRMSEVSDLRLVEVGVNCSLTQLLECGFYHADPHPGNLFRTQDGKLAYLDFGMMGEIKQDLRTGLIEACLHLINREFDELADDFITLGLLPPTSQRAEISNALTGVFRQAVSKGVRNISFGDLSGNLGLTMYRFKFRLPAYLSLVVRSLTVLEGIALSSDSNYKVLSSSYPWIARKVLTDDSLQLRSTLRALLYKDGVFRIDRLESLMSEAMRDTMAEPALDDASNQESKILLKQALKFSLSEQGLFVRDIMLDELAKGLDALNRAIFDAAAQSLLSRIPLAVPSPSLLVEEEDLENLSNLRRLSSILSGSSVTSSNIGEVEQSSDIRGDGSTELARVKMSHLLESLGNYSKYLPMLSVVPELPFSAQRAALLLPVDLAGRLASRSLARTIRNLVSRSVSSSAVRSHP